MWWCFGIIAAVILIAFLLGAAGDDDDDASGSTKRSRSIERRAQEIAAKVDSLAKFRALQRRLEDTDWNSSRYDVLEEAVGIASDKVLAWQFIPDVDLTTPLSVLKRAYKVYPLNKVDEAKAELGHDTWWYELRGDDEPEPPEEEFDFIMRFRKAVESKVTQRTKIKRINELCATRPDIAEEWFDPRSKFTPGDQWFADALGEAGLPLAHELYAEGYTTAEKCLEIDLDEFRARKGVGSKKVDALRQFQATIRDSIEEADAGESPP